MRKLAFNELFRLSRSVSSMQQKCTNAPIGPDVQNLVAGREARRINLIQRDPDQFGIFCFWGMKRRSPGDSWFARASHSSSISTRRNVLKR